MLLSNHHLKLVIRWLNSMKFIDLSAFWMIFSTLVLLSRTVILTGFLRSIQFFNSSLLLKMTMLLMIFQWGMAVGHSDKIKNNSQLIKFSNNLRKIIINNDNNLGISYISISSFLLSILNVLGFSLFKLRIHLSPTSQQLFEFLSLLLQNIQLDLFTSLRFSLCLLLFKDMIYFSLN